jgi:hypothetical protein
VFVVEIGGESCCACAAVVSVNNAATQNVCFIIIILRGRPRRHRNDAVRRAGARIDRGEMRHLNDRLGVRTIFLHGPEVLMLPHEIELDRQWSRDRVQEFMDRLADALTARARRRDVGDARARDQRRRRARR